MKAGPPIALVSSKVVLPDGCRPAAVLVAGPTISDVVDPGDVPADYSIVDFDDLVIAPGLIDAHVHINEPGRTEWEGFESATRAAAAGGVTTIVDMPLNSSPVTTSADALRAKRNAAGEKCNVDVGFYGGLVPGNQDELTGLVDGGVMGVKAFLCDSGLPEFPAASLGDVARAARWLAENDTPLLVHAELPTAAAGSPSADSMRAFAAHRRTWEPRAIEALVAISGETGCAVHVVHVSQGAGANLIEQAARRGVSISAETCPHYLTFCCEEIDVDDPIVKCAPPLHDAANREALWAAVAQGRIHTIGSDHSPCPPAMKAGRFADAWGGISSLQLTLPIVWSGFARRNLPIDLMFRLLAANPAELLGVGSRKGRIAVGLDADLCIWDPGDRWIVEGAALEHRHGHTPYEGATLTGRVIQTYLRGKTVFDQGQFPLVHSGEIVVPARKAI